MRGADPVNDEFEVGYDLKFENRWRRAELVGRAIMVIVVLAGLAGLLGRGPFSHRTAASPSGLLAVDYEPVARFDTPTQITLHVRPEPGSRTIEVLVDNKLIEPFGLQRILPQPIREQTQGGGMQVTFSVAPGATDQLLRFVTSPALVGPVTLSAEVVGGDRLQWTQFVVP